MTSEVIKVPDLGGADTVEVIEISVAVGDQISAEDTIVVLESDKATMEVPCPSDGEVSAILVKEGDKLSEGADILELLVATADSSTEQVDAVEEVQPEADTSNKLAEEPAQATQSTQVTTTSQSVEDIVVPDIGSDGEVEVIELQVAVGDEVAEGDNILVIETDKATVEMPISYSGVIESLAVSEGSKIKKGQVIGTVATTGAVSVTENAPQPEPSPVVEQPQNNTPQISVPAEPEVVQASQTASSQVYAGPAVRQLARKLGVDLSQVTGTGQRGRIIKEDVEAYVKLQLNAEASPASHGSGIPQVPDLDFSQFGDIEKVALTKIQKLTAANMSRSWLNVPHVTQFDDADITEMDSFRQSLKKEGEKRGIKITPLAFLLSASAKALALHPEFNRSLTSDGEFFVQKHYINIGMAVDTPKGLMVPVLKDVDQKGLWQIADEANQLATKAREGKLMPNDMQGGCFTVSSLGAIGGRGFTPIVNAPEVAILGVSKSSVMPVWNGSEFVPRTLLPLALSYDHRALNGVAGGQFLTTMVSLLSDVRRLLL